MQAQTTFKCENNKDKNNTEQKYRVGDLPHFTAIISIQIERFAMVIYLIKYPSHH
jgi:hypothetical protein